jgi:hypothetical protein
MKTETKLWYISLKSTYFVVVASSIRSRGKLLEAMVDQIALKGIMLATSKVSVQQHTGFDLVISKVLTKVERTAVGAPSDDFPVDSVHIREHVIHFLRKGHFRNIRGYGISLFAHGYVGKISVRMVDVCARTLHDPNDVGLPWIRLLELIDE